ncbi:collagen-like protein [bacterium]|nr:collagen-like protein [bacterium]
MKKIVFLFSVFVSAQLCADWSVATSDLGKGDEHCPNGGILISFSDSDKTKEENEQIPKAYVCNGEDGDDGCKMLANVSINSTNPDCKPAVVVKSGLDCDDNGVMDSEDSSVSICYGKNVSEDGSTEINAENAANGSDGNDGKFSEFVVTDEPAGENCETGGKKIENRFDKNGNGEFETSEISVSYVCNGESPQGPQGQSGKPVTSGLDGNDGSDGAKGERGDKGEQGEQGIQGEKGADGSDGRDTVMSVADEAAGKHCKAGGKKFMSGADANGNGVLDEAEVENIYYICNGLDAAEASEDVKGSGCAVTAIDTNPASFPSMISAVFSLVSNLFQ